MELPIQLLGGVTRGGARTGGGRREGGSQKGGGCKRGQVEMMQYKWRAVRLVYLYSANKETTRNK